MISEVANGMRDNMPADIKIFSVKDALMVVPKQ